MKILAILVAASAMFAVGSATPASLVVPNLVEFSSKEPKNQEHRVTQREILQQVIQLMVPYLQNAMDNIEDFAVIWGYTSTWEKSKGSFAETILNVKNCQDIKYV